MQLTDSCFLSHLYVIGGTWFLILGIWGYTKIMGWGKLEELKHFLLGAKDNSELTTLKLATSWNKYGVLFWLVILILSANILNHFGVEYFTLPPECK